MDSRFRGNDDEKARLTAASERGRSMIRKFRDRGLEELFNDGASRHIDKRHHRNCLLILDVLNMATCPQDLEGVKNFHPLKGNRAGDYAMHVNGNWCITFCFEDSDVTDVKFEDYH